MDQVSGTICYPVLSGRILYPVLSCTSQTVAEHRSHRFLWYLLFLVSCTHPKSMTYNLHGKTYLALSGSICYAVVCYLVKFYIWIYSIKMYIFGKSVSGKSVSGTSTYIYHVGNCDIVVYICGKYYVWYTWSIFICGINTCGRNTHNGSSQPYIK